MSSPSQTIESFLKGLGLQRYSVQIKLNNINSVDDLKANAGSLQSIFQNAIAAQRVLVALNQEAAGSAPEGKSTASQADPLRAWERKLQEKLREISRQRAKLVISRAGRMEILQISQEAERGNAALRLCHRALRLKERLAEIRREARSRKGVSLSDLSVEAGELKNALRDTLQHIRELPLAWGMDDSSNVPRADDLDTTTGSTRSKSSPAPSPRARTPVKRSAGGPGPRQTHHRHVDAHSSAVNSSARPTPPGTPKSCYSDGGNTATPSMFSQQEEFMERIEQALRTGHDDDTSRRAQESTWLRQAFSSLQGQMRHLHTQVQGVQQNIRQLDLERDLHASGASSSDVGCQTEPISVLGLTHEVARSVESRCGSLVAVPPPAVIEGLLERTTSFVAQWNAFVVYIREVHSSLEDTLRHDFSTSTSMMSSMAPLCDSLSPSDDAVVTSDEGPPFEKDYAAAMTGTSPTALKSALTANQRELGLVLQELRSRLTSGGPTTTSKSEAARVVDDGEDDTTTNNNTAVRNNGGLSNDVNSNDRSVSPGVYYNGDGVAFDLVGHQEILGGIPNKTTV